MSREYLDRAYAMIKDGQTQEAIPIIEAIIRADRDNEDAWWLLANATDEPATKRNALNNVIRLSKDTERVNKSQSMLNRLLNPNATVDESPASTRNIPPATKNRSKGVGKFVIGFLVIFGLCACVSVIGVFFAARPMFSAFHVPDSYNNQGIIEGTSNFTGSISDAAPTDGYRLHGTTNERITVTVSSSSEYAPYIFVYELESGLLINLAQATGLNSPTQLTFTIPSDGDYLITVRSFTIFGETIGSGDYTMKIEVAS